MRDFQTTPPNLHEAEPIPEAAREAIDALLSSGDLFRYTAPADAPVALLEREFAQMMGTKYALAVSSCSAALFLSLKSLSLPEKAKVLIPAFTFAAVPSAVVHAGMTPVLVDVGMNYRIDLADFERKISDADAVLISHMRGHTSDMDAILTLAEAHNLPVIEDAAHSLGTLWKDRKIGTMGHVGCFSFQSYKMINAGEGGIMITDDPDLAARAIIMSGAYEHNWQKHDIAYEKASQWQNKLPLYNLRMQNLSACVIRPQLAELPRRVRDGLENHDHVADRLTESGYFNVPAPLPSETRAPDSIQFNLIDFSEAEARAFLSFAKENGVPAQVFGLGTDNARAFWNWEFIEGDTPNLPQTRAMLAQACDVRLPVRLKREELDFVASALIDAAIMVKG